MVLLIFNQKTKWQKKANRGTYVDVSGVLPLQVRPVTRVISVTDGSFIDQISQHLFFYSLSLVGSGSLATRILTFMLGKAWPDYLDNERLIRGSCSTFILDQICGPKNRRELHLCIFGHVLSLVYRSSLSAQTTSSIRAPRVWGEVSH